MCDFKILLKRLASGSERIFTVRPLQAEGPEYENARSPSLVRSRGKL